MINVKRNFFYKFNLLFGILLFLVTISFRNDIVYGAIDDWSVTSNVLNVWNWLMLISLGIAVVQTIILTSRFGGVLYCLLCVLLIVFLIIATIGMFIVPEGTRLS